MQKTIAVINQKGGLGKTTTINLASGLVTEGKKVHGFISRKFTSSSA